MQPTKKLAERLLLARQSKILVGAHRSNETTPACRDHSKSRMHAPFSRYCRIDRCYIVASAIGAAFISAWGNAPGTAHTQVSADGATHPHHM